VSKRDARDDTRRHPDSLLSPKEAHGGDDDDDGNVNYVRWYAQPKHFSHAAGCSLIYRSLETRCDRS